MSVEGCYNFGLRESLGGERVGVVDRVLLRHAVEANCAASHNRELA